MTKFLAALGIYALGLSAQNIPAGQLKHLMIPAEGDLGSSAAAMVIVKTVGYPSTIHLKGQVEIRTPVCVRPEKGKGLVCEGYMVLRADEAVVHEDTGQIEPSGHVSLTRTKKGADAPQ